MAEPTNYQFTFTSKSERHTQSYTSDGLPGTDQMISQMIKFLIVCGYDEASIFDCLDDLCEQHFSTI
jgi:hypothetical protein